MNSKAIQALVSLGADAHTNLYDVFIKFPWEDSAWTMARANGFNVNKAANPGYDITYHGNKIKLPQTEVNFDRTFTITFRSDAAYSLYGLFITWQSAVVDPVNGGVANYAALLGEVTVRGLGGLYTAAEEAKTLVDDDGSIKASSQNPEWQFKQVWVADVGQPQYSTESAGQFSFEVQFHFADTNYPFYNGAPITGTSK